MSKKPIHSYRELVEERKRLEELLKAQRELLRADVFEVRQALQPAADTFSFAGKLLTRKNSPLLLNTVANTSIQFLLNKVLLRKASFLTRFAVPFMAKNLSSHIISEKFSNKMREFFLDLVDRFAPHRKEEAGSTDPAAEQNG